VAVFSSSEASWEWLAFESESCEDEEECIFDEFVTASEYLILCCVCS